MALFFGISLPWRRLVGATAQVPGISGAGSGVRAPERPLACSECPKSRVRAPQRHFSCSGWRSFIVGLAT